MHTVGLFTRIMGETGEEREEGNAPRKQKKGSSKGHRPFYSDYSTIVNSNC